MPKQIILGNRITVEYDPDNPEEKMEILKAQLRGKNAAQLTATERNTIITTVLNLAQSEPSRTMKP